MGCGAAQLAERSLPTPEVRSSNPIDKLYKTYILSTVYILSKRGKIQKKRPGMAHFLKKKGRHKS